MQHSIPAITKEIIKDNAWATKLGYAPLFTAHKSARIALIGQAPGIRAQKSGVPWNDQSGIRLRDWLGVSGEDFYDPKKISLIPMDFYYPGKSKSGDKPPRKDFAPKWHPQLLECMPDIRLLVIIGQYAQNYYLGDTAKKNLTETVKNFELYAPKFFPLPHPSPRNNIWLRRNPWFEKRALPKLRCTVASALD